MRRLPLPVPAVAAILLVAALAGLGAGAVTAQGGAASPSATPSAAAAPTAATNPPSSPTVGSQPTQALSVQVDREAAAAYQTVTLRGDAASMAAGTTLVVQRRTDAGWEDIPGHTVVTGEGTYRIGVRLGRPGENVLRVALAGSGGSSASPAVSVTIRG